MILRKLLKYCHQTSHFRAAKIHQILFLASVRLSQVGVDTCYFSLLSSLCRAYSQRCVTRVKNLVDEFSTATHRSGKNAARAVKATP